MLQTNKINSETNIYRSRIKPKFNLVGHIEKRDINDITEVVEVHVYWGGQ